MSRLLKLGNWIVRIADSAESLNLDLTENNSVLSEAISTGQASYYSVDVREESQVSRAIEGSSVVFYVDPANLRLHDVYFCYIAIVQGAKNVINACRKCNVKRLIYNSSADVVFDGSRDICDGDESFPNSLKFEDMLSCLKVQAEAMVLYANDYDSLLTCALRPSNVFGPGDTELVPFCVDQATSGWGKFIIGSGENMSDFTFVENVAHAHICAEEALVSRTVSVAGKAFFITNLEPMKYWEFVSLLLEGLGYQRPSINIPARLALCILSKVKVINEKLGFRKHNLSLSAQYVVQLASHTRTFNCTEAQKLIGYSPVVSLKEGLASTIESFSHLAKNSSFIRYGVYNEGSRAEKLLGCGKVADILLWRDEKKTFTYFLALVLLFYWFFLSGRTFVSSAANLLLLATVILYVHAILPSNIFGFSVQRISLSSFEMSKMDMRDSVTNVAYMWNRVVCIIRSLAEGQDWSIFFKVAASLYFIKRILLHSTAMIGAVLIFAFTLFFIYEQHEKEIDGLANISMKILKKFMEVLTRKLPASVSSFLHHYRILHQDRGQAALNTQQKLT